MPPKRKVNKISSLTLEEASECSKCKKLSKVVEIVDDYDYVEGECVYLFCPDQSCKHSWCFCNTCCLTFNINNAEKHSKGKCHGKKHRIVYPTVGKRNLNPSNNCSSGSSNHGTTIEIMEITQDVATPKESIESESEQQHQHFRVTVNELQEVEKSMFPDINLQGNQWLCKLMKDTPIATVPEIRAALEGENEDTKNFWIAEQGNREGKCGGGVCLIVAAAFQQSSDSKIDKSKLPDWQEAIWQYENMRQYQANSESQRARQLRIMADLKVPFLKQTKILHYNETSKHYGSTSKNSMYMRIPTPIPRMIDGVAYMSPLDIAKHFWYNGVPMDDCIITKDSFNGNVDDESRKVLFPGECHKAVSWTNEVVQNYFLAPDSNEAPIHDSLVGCMVSDWKDGASCSRVKNNRHSLDIKTFTIGPPKDCINGTGNTYACAFGLKQANGWPTVERVFLKDLEKLTNPSPKLFYNGIIKKMVPVVFKRMVSLSDKMERPYVTGTIGPTSDCHRRYGFSGRICTPSCNIPNIEAYMILEQNGTRKGALWGWSDSYILPTANGAMLPACRKCRASGLRKLGIPLSEEPPEDDVNGICACCANWNLISNDSTSKLLHYTPVNYPTRIHEGSPIPAPFGRDSFQKGQKLQIVKLSWKMMKQASRFAFYQASRPKKFWGKGLTIGYLTNCGIIPTFSEDLFKEAEAARCIIPFSEDYYISLEDYYHKDDGIGSVSFPAAWMSDLEVGDFVEGVMHILQLGVASSNFELVVQYLKMFKPAAKLGAAAFHRDTMDLLKDLKAFQLSWLLVLPFTTGKELKTGAWVAENWLAFIRISKLLFGWCIRDHDIQSKFGVDDLSRMMIAFTAFISRCLTHGGIDADFIKETDLYLKEFLSCVREFDVRVQYKILNKRTNKTANGRKKEAFWLKANYLSLNNLLDMMERLGPLVNWWDGGGKGEKFIQLVKPLLRKGVRLDLSCFFEQLMKKLYKVSQSIILDKRYGLDGGDSLSLMDVIIEIAEDMIPEFSDDIANGEPEPSPEEPEPPPEEPIRREDEAKEDSRNEAYFTPLQEDGMMKKKAIHVYKNESDLNMSIAEKKPIAGIVVFNESEKAFEFQIVVRQPVRMLCRRVVNFDDKNGVSFHGQWCAGIQVETQDSISYPLVHSDNFVDIKKGAKFSAVAIPLWYVIGPDQPNSNKYCVITNWWNERTRDGSYKLPVLDPSLYTPEPDAAIPHQNLNIPHQNLNELLSIGSTNKQTNDVAYGVI